PSLLLFFYCHRPPRLLPSFPTRRSSDLNYYEKSLGGRVTFSMTYGESPLAGQTPAERRMEDPPATVGGRLPRQYRKPQGLWLMRSEEHTSELQSPCNIVCRLLLEKKKQK